MMGQTHKITMGYSEQLDPYGTEGTSYPNNHSLKFYVKDLYGGDSDAPQKILDLQIQNLACLRIQIFLL